MPYLLEEDLLGAKFLILVRFPEDMETEIVWFLKSDKRFFYFVWKKAKKNQKQPSCQLLTASFEQELSFILSDSLLSWKEEHQQPTNFVNMW